MGEAAADAREDVQPIEESPGQDDLVEGVAALGRECQVGAASAILLAKVTE